MSLIALADITADQRAQPRASMLPEKIGEYTEDMERGDKFPPVVVFYDGKKYWLADGFHRFYAAGATATTKIDCHVRDGGLRDAILFSCGANAAHGLRRTSEDKRRAIAKLLDDVEWSKWSDSEIARQCCVSQPSVGKLRKEIAAVSPKKIIGEAISHRKYTTKSGTEAVMKLPQRDKKADGVLIAKWLHEIERLVDLMPDPPEAIAAFPEGERYFFPPSKVEYIAGWFAEFAEGWRADMKAKTK